MIECYTQTKILCISVYVFGVEVDVYKKLCLHGYIDFLDATLFQKKIFNDYFGELDWSLQDSLLKFMSFILIHFFSSYCEK